MAMDFLIQSDWYEAYAARLGLVPSSQDVTRTFNAEKSQTFPTESKFNAFLKQEGETVADIRFRVQVSMIATRLAARQKGNQSAQTAARSGERSKTRSSPARCARRRWRWRIAATTTPRGSGSRAS